MGRGETRQQRCFPADAGASVVEFAFLVPLLILLLCGIIEVGWLFTQNLDVRHGAAEIARLVAVGEKDPGRACSRLDVASGSVTVLVDTGDGEVGADATVTVYMPADTLTGVLDWAFPASMTLEHTATARLEQENGWGVVTFSC